MITSRLDAYISKYGDFCANNDNNDNDDTTDYFTPCACARGKYLIRTRPLIGIIVWHLVHSLCSQVHADRSVELVLGINDILHLDINCHVGSGDEVFIETHRPAMAPGQGQGLARLLSACARALSACAAGARQGLAQRAARPVDPYSLYNNIIIAIFIRTFHLSQAILCENCHTIN